MVPNRRRRRWRQKGVCAPVIQINGPFPLSLSLKRTHTLAFPPSQLETERAETSEIKTAAHSLALYSNGVSMAGENMGIEQQEKRGTRERPDQTLMDNAGTFRCHLSGIL